MASGVGLDAINLPSSGAQCSLAGRRNSGRRGVSSVWLFRRPARVAKAGVSVRKCGSDLKRESGEARARNLGHGDAGELRRVRVTALGRAGEFSSSCCCASDVGPGVSLPGRRFSAANVARKGKDGGRARCEADGAGGGVSYDDRIATVEAEAEVQSGSGEGDGNGTAGRGPGGDGRGPSEVVEGVARAEGEGEEEESALEILQEILRGEQEELENCQRTSKALEERAQRVAEEAIALNDEARERERAANAAQAEVEALAGDEARARGEVEKAEAAKGAVRGVLKDAKAKLEATLSRVKAENGTVVNLRPELLVEDGKEEESVEARLQVTTARTVEISVAPGEEEAAAQPDVVVENETKRTDTGVTVEGVTADAAVAMAAAIMEEAEAVDSARGLLRESSAGLAKAEAQLGRVQAEKAERERDLVRLSEAAEAARERAAAADEDVARAMAEAERAVAEQLEAAQRVSDAEHARQKADVFAVEAARQASALAAAEAEKLALASGKTLEDIEEKLEGRVGEGEAVKSRPEDAEEKKEGAPVSDAAVTEKVQDEIAKPGDDLTKHGADRPSPEASATAAAAERVAKEAESESKKAKEPEPVKEPPLPKAVKKRSSKFFSASYFSSEEGEEFSPGTAYAQLVTSMREQLGKVIIGVALLFAGGAYMNKRMDKPLLQPEPPAITSTIEQAMPSRPIVAKFKKISRRVVDVVSKIPVQEVKEEEASLFDVLWLLLASVIFVPLFTKIPGGSPVLGYLVAGVLIGPHTAHIIQNVHGTKAIAEFGVVFLLFNIGLELSVDRLSSMKKYVFGLGSAQVLATATGVGVVLTHIAKITGPPAIIIASGLALSSTAVVLQVLQERGESTSRHGRATFSVLLFQDLAVVVLLILIPLLSSSGGIGLKEIGAALGAAGVKAVVAIVGIIASGRLFLRPIYKQMADNHNPEIFAANTLLVVLGTSLLTARAGLSMALGAFLAGLLLAETEFALQVESDIAPYRGLLLGLFFMTVGMSIDPKLLVAKFPEIAGALALLIVGKTFIVAIVGRVFGLSLVAAVRTGLLLAPGGEFAFVAFGEAVNQGIMSSQLSSLLFLVVGLSMALTPWLAAGGQLIAAKFEQQDVRFLLPQENETDDLQGHIIICGFGRVGQIIAQLLSERLIPFVALDVRSDRVSFGRQLDLPVYFGDAGSKEVLHKVGADRAAAAVITLDTPGANYRTVWALCKHFPEVKTFVRAHDVDHGLTLEKAGATAVVPETLEPSLQLAAAVLAQAKVPASEISSAIDDFRSRHLSELAELSEISRTSLGYGFSKLISKPMLEAVMKDPDDNGLAAESRGIIEAVP